MNKISTIYVRHYYTHNLMTSTVITLIVIGILGLFIIFAIIGVYNKLVTLKNRFENAFSQIEVQLQRRYDLIPNLIETVKGYMAHEKETLEAVIQARNQAQSSLQTASQNPGDASAMAGLAGAEGMLGGALGRIFALSESYPDLKANQNMANLQEELSSTENKVAFSRQAFNDSVTTYNTYKQTFPPVFFAGMFGHGQDATLLEFETEKIKEAPKVQF
ncbi:LemA family protein [Opitutales bacterium]|nr:LemA family protein [Opitutales bacterium]